MAITYEPIGTTTLTSTAAISFTSIPATYTDLILVTKLNVSGGNDVDLRFNGDTGSNYSYVTFYGTGSARGSTRAGNLTFARIDYYGYAETNVGHINIAHIQNYSNTNMYKAILARNNNASNGTGLNSCLWRSNSAINSIAIIGNYDAGSVATLYGIKEA